MASLAALMESTPTGAPWPDLEAAVSALAAALDERAARLPHAHAVELSGGVDSSLVALAAVRAGSSPVALTVTTDPDDPAQDAPAARRVAEDLGLTWRPVLVTPERARRLAAFAVELLGGRGLYQVVGAMATLAMAEEVRELHGRVVWSGDSADSLFGPYGVPGRPGGTRALDWAGRVAAVRHAEAQVAASGYGDAHQRALGEGIDVVDLFAEGGVVAVAARCEGLLDDGRDKAPVRALAEAWGLDAALARRDKTPLQVGSGLFALLAELARADELELTDDRTLDPVRREGRDAEILAAYWLALRHAPPGR